jgi:hypothetical protein
LLLVMWMSAALAAIALSVSATIRTEADHTSTVADGLRAHYLAVGSVDRMLTWMSWGPVTAGQAKGWNPVTPRYYMSYGSGDVVVELISEASKLNVNDASPNDLAPVISVVTGNPGQTAQIVEGIMNRRRPGGVSPNPGQILQPGSTFGRRNASFQEIEELLSVPGVTPEVFYGNYISDAEGRLYARGGLRDVLSVWGTRGQFDVNGASPALLEALGIPPDRVQAILKARPFRNMAQVQAIAGTTRGLRIDGISMWTVRATARLRRPDGSPSDVLRSAAAVAKVWMEGGHPGNPVQVVRYYPDAWSEFAAKPEVTVMGGVQ